MEISSLVAMFLEGHLVSVPFLFLWGFPVILGFLRGVPPLPLLWRVLLAFLYLEIKREPIGLREDPRKLRKGEE